MALTLHERVAAAMKRSYSAGTYNSYEYILEKLRAKFPTEELLQAQISVIEARMKEAGLWPKGMKFPDDAIFEPFLDGDHGSA